MARSDASDSAGQLAESVEQIRDGLRAGRFANEAAVSQGIVLRLLNDLAWPTYDTRVVCPEFAVGPRRVDFALCHRPGKPSVFIEVKQVGQGVDAQRQLFEYAFHQGVPLAILTTGQEWHFFLPAESGSYEERRVYMLDLLERDSAESIARLTRYLEFTSVESGSALEAARADYRDIARDRDIQRTLPEAWQRLISDGDELLVDLVAEKVESLCGFRPAPAAVLAFLSGVKAAPPAVVSRPIIGTVRNVQPVPVPAHGTNGRERSIPTSGGSLSFSFRGQTIQSKTARDVLVGVLRQFADLDPSFPEKFHRKRSVKKQRRYIARSPVELYPQSPHLAEISSNTSELRPGSGWYVDLNLSRQGVEKVIRLACDVAGVEFGRELQVKLE